MESKFVILQLQRDFHFYYNSTLLSHITNVRNPCSAVAGNRGCMMGSGGWGSPLCLNQFPSESPELQLYFWRNEDLGTLPLSWRYNLHALRRQSVSAFLNRGEMAAVPHWLLTHQRVQLWPLPCSMDLSKCSWHKLSLYLNQERREWACRETQKQ